MQWKRWAATVIFLVLLLYNSDGLTAYAAPSVSSLSAVVYEPESGQILYEKDGRTARPMASTTKLMTALLTVENLDPNSTVTVPAAALPVEGTQIGLKAGEQITVRDLLAGLLLASGNDTANVLALSMDDSLSAFARRMNNRALMLSMTDSLFVTPSGLDKDGHSASARDMALLGAAVLEKPLLAELCASKAETITVGGIRVTVTNHNKLLKLYDGTVGLKTGFTKKSGRCLVSAAQRNGVTLVIATLNGGDYWNDHISLYEYAFSLVCRQTLPVVSLSVCPVAGGMEDSIPLTHDAIPACVVQQGEIISAQVELPSFVWAPICEGDVLGHIRYTAGDRELACVPIRAAGCVYEREQPPVHRQVWQWFCILGETLLK